MALRTQARLKIGPTPIARAIPGLRHLRQRTSKKPVQSVGNGNEERCGSLRIQPEGRLTFTRRMQALVLPLGPDAQDRWRAVMNTATSFALTFCSLCVVHLPFAIHSRSSGLLQALHLTWRDLVTSHLGHLLLYGALLTLFSYAEGLYDIDYHEGLVEHAMVAVKVVVWATLVWGVGLRLSGAVLDFGVLSSVAGWVLIGLCIIGFIERRPLWGNGNRGARAKNVLIVGTVQAARKISGQLSGHRGSARVVKGVLTDVYTRAPSVLGTVEHLPEIARAEFIDEVIVASGTNYRMTEKAIAQALRNHLDVSVIPEFYAEWPARLAVRKVGTLPLIALHEEPIPRLGLFLKRIIDIAVSATALILLAPLFALVAVLIKLESPGPFIYSALRAGRKGQPFACFKFRTMFADADGRKDALRERNERTGPTFKIANDPRITPLGQILRRYSVDELPQLWNVLTGSMSVVGPRPHPLDDYERYGLGDLRRLDVAPGLTGLWQVTARGDPSFDTNMRLDLDYIENWSLGLDIAILWKTTTAVLAGTGA